jgi:hypothetical protein
MTDDARELGDIDVEAIDEDVDQVEVDQVVRELLTRDEARVMSIASLALIAVGLVFTLGWIVVLWRTESELSSTRGFSSSGGAGLVSNNPDLVDRIIAAEQVGVLVLLALLLVAAGCGLRLFASRLLASPPPLD